ncbi:hypothetical protein N7541_005780 [Penicillium brevicompactum]|uniref:Uncharacterized protein n=1 Tax=Penicillium brevicompactum TaxID=5074 RepID=A0A9W9R6Z1_PENBR|nr:hypothetical protein N7541_005780 [Penicillium brevicompactum]
MSDSIQLSLENWHQNVTCQNKSWHPPPTLPLGNGSNITDAARKSASKSEDNWKGQLVTGGFTLFGLLIVSDFLYYLFKNNARNAQLSNPQALLTDNYLQEMEQWSDLSPKDCFYRVRIAARAGDFDRGIEHRSFYGAAFSRRPQFQQFQGKARWLLVPLRHPRAPKEVEFRSPSCQQGTNCQPRHATKTLEL